MARKIKAPWLTIKGKPVYKGDTYFTVHFENGKAIIMKHVASTENNVSRYSYYLDESQAKKKAALLEIEYFLKMITLRLKVLTENQ